MTGIPEKGAPHFARITGKDKDIGGREAPFKIAPPSFSTTCISTTEERNERMKKIMIVGSAGSGKSTLARRLGRMLDIEVIHLDAHYRETGMDRTVRGGMAPPGGKAHPSGRLDHGRKLHQNH